MGWARPNPAAARLQGGRVGLWARSCRTTEFRRVVAAGSGTRCCGGPNCCIAIATRHGGGRSL